MRQKKLSKPLSIKIGICLLALLAWLPTAGLGQTVTGRLAGIVTDPQGAAVVNAQIKIANTATGREHEETTDDIGAFLITNLEPGEYRLTASAPGFRTAVVEKVIVQVATTANVNLSLVLGSTSETVNVTGEAPLVETKSSEIGAVITGDATRRLPLNGRDFTQLGRLVAGVTPDSEGGNAPFAVNGQRSSANNFLVDGVDANQPYFQINASGPAGTSTPFASVESIAEFKVQTGQFPAEFGRNAGSVINVITRAGTNEFHGSLFEFFRNDVLDANNFFTNASGLRRPPLKNNQFGGSLGGPIQRKASFFFFTYEALRGRVGTISNGTVPSLAARAAAQGANSGNPVYLAVLDQIVLPTAPPEPNGLVANFTGVAISKVREDDFNLRLDHEFSRGDTLFVRYALSDGEQNMAGQVISAAPNVRALTPMRLQIFSLNETHNFSSRLINEARFGFHRNHQISEFSAVPLFGAQPGPVTNGLPNLPIVIVADESLNGGIVAGMAGPNGQSANIFQFTDNLNLQSTRHALKAGFDIRHVQLNLFDEGANGGASGLLVFQQLTLPGEGGPVVLSATEALIQNLPAAFIRRIGNSARGFRYTNFAFFGQDDWRVDDRLAFNFGIRFEVNTVLRESQNRINNLIPSPGGTFSLTQPGDVYSGDHNNFAPRFGFAYALRKDGRMAFRGGFGVYFDQATLVTGNLASNPLFNLTTTVPVLAFSQFVPGFSPNYPNFLPFLPPVPVFTPLFGNGSAGMVPRDMRTPYTYQYGLNWQAQLNGQTLLQVGYVGSRGVKLLRGRIVNFPLPFGPIPGPITGVTDPNFSVILVNEPATSSFYNGLQATIERRFHRGLSFLANYTWSHSIDGASTLGLIGTSINGTRAASPFPSNPNQPAGERGNSNFDLLHSFTASYAWDLPLDHLGGLDRVSEKFVKGWSLEGITQAHTGQPFTVAVGFDAAGLGDPTPFFSQRPNVVPGQPLALGERQGPQIQLNPAAFAPPAPGTFGNLGRNTFRGPNFVQFDFGLAKRTPIGERVTSEFRVEFFNLFNHPNFASPSENALLSTVFTNPASFGRSIQTLSTASPRPSPVFAAGGPRNIQLALKFRF